MAQSRAFWRGHRNGRRHFFRGGTNMDRSTLKACLSVWVVVSSLLVSTAHAQDADDAASSSDDTAASPSTTDKDKKPEEATTPPPDAKKEEVADAEAGNSPAELPGKTYYFVGARYRGIVVPKFMENLFASGGRTVYVNAFGPEFGIRKNDFEYSLSPWLGLYNMGDTGFKGASDPKEAWEIISAKIQILYLTADFLWSHEFTPEIAVNYGLGAGFGFVFGDLHRNQSYPNPANPNGSPDTYLKCPSQNFPTAGGNYCDDKNDHYGNYTEKNWANGGSQPLLFPWLTVQTGLRFKPSHSFAARLDLGFGTSGFFFGLGGDYGL
jgi:hypothetical protein